VANKSLIPSKLKSRFGLSPEKINTRKRINYEAANSTVAIFCSKNQFLKANLGGKKSGIQAKSAMVLNKSKS
jgi:hypothetical protein